MELLDPSGQGRDGGLPHRARLTPHAHGQLDLEGVHPVDLGVVLNNVSSVIVAQLAWAGSAG